MSDYWYDPLELGAGDLLSSSLGQTPLATAWPDGGTLGTTPLSELYRAGQTLGDAPLATTWPPDVATPPVTIWEDGFENQNHNAYINTDVDSGWSGRAQSCDCYAYSGGACTGPPSAQDLDGFVAVDSGYAMRVTSDPACYNPNASCRNGCEYFRGWPSYRLGQTEYLGHRMRVVAPFTAQATGNPFCMVSQFGYCQLKFNALGLEIDGSNLRMICFLGYSDTTANSDYANADGYQPMDGVHAVDTGEWHDYIWKVTYSTIFGTDATHPIAGELVLYHRKPDTTSSWTTLFDSKTLNPSGVPTRQWGYGVNDNVSEQVDDLGINLKTVAAFDSGQPRWTFDKLGVYRSSFEVDGVNNNTLTVDHRKHCTATSFENCESYLNWPG